MRGPRPSAERQTGKIKENVLLVISRRSYTGVKTKMTEKRDAPRELAEYD